LWLFAKALNDVATVSIADSIGFGDVKSFLLCLCNGFCE